MELVNKRIEFIQTLRDGLVEQDDEMNDIPYWDLDFLIQRYGDFSEEDIRLNQKIKDIKKYTKEGYSQKDAEKIVSGEPKDKFKKKKKTC